MDGVKDSEKDLVSEYSYWVGYIYGAFQGPLEEDLDGYDEYSDSGMCYNGTYAAIFLEVIYEDANPILPLTVEKCQGMERMIVVHETAHEFGLADDVSGPGIMNVNRRTLAEGDLSPDDEFTDENIRDIRHRDYPGH